MTLPLLRGDVLLALALAGGVAAPVLREVAVALGLTVRAAAVMILPPLRPVAVLCWSGGVVCGLAIWVTACVTIRLVRHGRQFERERAARRAQWERDAP
jgi:hypothetical protein